jgi:hypothetical protein
MQEAYEFCRKKNISIAIDMFLVPCIYLHIHKNIFYTVSHKLILFLQIVLEICNM